MPGILAEVATVSNDEEARHLKDPAYRQQIAEALSKGIPSDSDAYLKIEDALRKSNLRLDAVKRFRRGPVKPARITDETR